MAKGLKRVISGTVSFLFLLSCGAQQCSFPCVHGTCNEQAQRCDCPPGVGGSDCSRVVTPSCVLQPGEVLPTSAQAPPWDGGASCACVEEWLTLMRATLPLVAWNPSSQVACFDAVPGTPLQTVWALAAAGQVNQSVITVAKDLNFTKALLEEPERARHIAWETEPLSNCPHNCSLHGFCSRRDGGRVSGTLRKLRNGTAEEPRCVCWGHSLGAGCESPHPAAPKDGSGYCLNSCRNVGTCVRGTCVCPVGTWGADCSITKVRQQDGTSQIRLLRAFGPDFHDVEVPAPPVYVYDLPPSLVTWQLWMPSAGISVDWGRTAGWRFLEAALRSAHRIASPPPDASNSSGTVFIVPIVGHSWVERVRPFNYVRQAYPYLNASAAAVDLAGGSPNHVWPIMPGDTGLQQAIPELYNDLDRDTSGDKLPDLMRLNVFLPHQALHLGYTRNDNTHNATFWKRGVGATREATAHNKGLFVPGKDIFAAAADKQNGCLPPAEMQAQNKTRMFWWTGSLMGNDINASSARATVVRLHSNTSGFSVNHAHGLNDDEGMRSSRFCMAPSGVGGGYGSRDARAVSVGCYPVYLQDYTSTPMDDLIPISLYGLHPREADIPKLPELLASANLKAEQLWCTCRALHWPWVRIEDNAWTRMENGTQGGDALDTEGGWVSLLMIMRRRQMKLGPLTDACDALGAAKPSVSPAGAAQALSPPPAALEARSLVQFTTASSPSASSVNDTCYGADYSPFLRNIHEDLMPWAQTGISAAMVDAATEYTLQRRGFAGLAFLIRAQKLYIIGAREVDFERVDGGKGPPRNAWTRWLMTYVQVLQRLVERAPPGSIPDVEFVLQQGDKGPGEWNLAAADNETHTPWRELRHLPMMRYCKSAETPEILIPYHHFWEQKVTARVLNNTYPPWEKRLDAVFGSHHEYGRVQSSLTTTKRDANGLQLPEWSRGSPRAYLKNTSVWANGTNVTELRINVEHLPMPEWSKYKYIAHVDGVACSSKLEQVLGLGSLVFVEQSGYRSFYHRLMQPFKHYIPFWTHRPQELLDALAWARANDDAARAIAAEGRAFALHFLNVHALSCYFKLLFREYARLQTFVPGERLNSSMLVPATEYLRWAQRADNGTKAFILPDIELE